MRVGDSAPRDCAEGAIQDIEDVGQGIIAWRRGRAGPRVNSLRRRPLLLYRSVAWPARKSAAIPRQQTLERLDRPQPRFTMPNQDPAVHNNEMRHRARPPSLVALVAFRSPPALGGSRPRRRSPSRRSPRWSQAAWRPVHGLACRKCHVVATSRLPQGALAPAEGAERGLSQAIAGGAAC